MYPPETALSTVGLYDLEPEYLQEALRIVAQDDLSALLSLPNITPEDVADYMLKAHGEVWDALTQDYIGLSDDPDIPFTAIDREVGELPGWFRPTPDPDLILNLPF